MSQDLYEDIWQHLDKPGERDALMDEAQQGHSITSEQFTRLKELHLYYAGAEESYETAEGSPAEGFFMPDSFRIFVLHKAAAAGRGGSAT